jgi:hypothetical protein
LTVEPEFEDDSDEVYEGIVQNVINAEKGEFSIVLRNCKNCDGKDLPGNQTFEKESIRYLIVLKEGDGRMSSPQTSSSTSRAARATNSNGWSSRPMGQQQRFRNDNDHLKNLHPIQVIIIYNNLPLILQTKHKLHYSNSLQKSAYSNTL